MDKRFQEVIRELVVEYNETLVDGEEPISQKEMEELIREKLSL